MSAFRVYCNIVAYFQPATGRDPKLGALGANWQRPRGAPDSILPQPGHGMGLLIGTLEQQYSTVLDKIWLPKQPGGLGDGTRHFALNRAISRALAQS